MDIAKIIPNTHKFKRPVFEAAPALAGWPDPEKTLPLY